MLSWIQVRQNFLHDKWYFIDNHWEIPLFPLQGGQYPWWWRGFSEVLTGMDLQYGLSLDTLCMVHQVCHGAPRIKSIIIIIFYKSKKQFKSWHNLKDQKQLPEKIVQQQHWDQYPHPHPETQDTITGPVEAASTWYSVGWSDTMQYWLKLSVSYTKLYQPASTVNCTWSFGHKLIGLK